MRDFAVLDLGLMEYREAEARQREIVEAVIGGAAPDTLIFVEHPPVLTLGANFHPENLLHPLDWYMDQGIDVIATDRGGDVTYHGPGQLVAYPIFDLRKRGRDVHLWLRTLEEVVIQSLAGFGVSGRRFPPHTGVWVGDEKICAIGIKVRRWVSMHGLALNCNNDLSPFDSIVPCGIEGYGITSLSRVLGKDVRVESLRGALQNQALQVSDPHGVGA